MALPYELKIETAQRLQKDITEVTGDEIFRTALDLVQSNTSPPEEDPLMLSATTFLLGVKAVMDNTPVNNRTEYENRIASQMTASIVERLTTKQ